MKATLYEIDFHKEDIKHEIIYKVGSIIGKNR